MSINDLPALSALRTKMQWHQERQRVLSENVSNSDTPNFRPRELVEPKFDKAGAVTVTGITPIQPHGLRVVGYALRPNENWRPTPSPLGRAFLGMERRSLARLGFKGHTGDAVCHPRTGSGYEPAVRVVKTTTGKATSAGWTIAKP